MTDAPDPALLGIATAIAEHLEGFTAAPGLYSHLVMLRHNDGRELGIRFKQYPHTDRLTIGGHFPRMDHKYIQPRGVDVKMTINVASNREPRSIAKDIERRLLPGVTVGHAAVLDEITRLQDDATSRKAVAERLATALGVAIPNQQGDEEITLYASSNSALYQIRVSGADSVRFEHFYCTPDEAELVIRACAR